MFWSWWPSLSSSWRSLSTNHLAPHYTSELLQVYTPSRNLWSSSMLLLIEPMSRHHAQRIWNSSLNLTTQWGSGICTRKKIQISSQNLSYVTGFQELILLCLFFFVLFLVVLRFENPAGWICAHKKSLLLSLIIIICSVEVKNDDRNAPGRVSWTQEVTIIIQGEQVDLGQNGMVKVRIHSSIKE